MAVPLSTYLMALILAIGTCFCGETKKGCQAATPGIPLSGAARHRGRNLTAKNKDWLYVSADKRADALYV
jgi:hypothetical protein